MPGPARATSIGLMSEHDYVIVGSGPAGCALAARLSSDPARRVLLLEAGGSDRDPRIRMPAGMPLLFGSRHDWNFETPPIDGLDGRRLYVPRGRTLGGTSSINAQMYIRGHRRDFDDWALPGWSYDDLLPLFRRAERNSRGADAFHGGDGPWHVTDARDPSPLSHAFVAAAQQSGIPANDDFNGAALDGVGLAQLTQHRGRRWNAADAYLRPVMRRPNLEVITGAQVTRVLVREGRAHGVAYRRRGDEVVARARREVLLCAGAIGSPHLLMLSGIGPAEHLRAHGVRVLRDLPGVGQNLQEHVLLTGPTWESTRPLTMAGAQSPVQLAKYLFGRRGLLSSNAVEAAAFVRSDPGLSAPDLELFFALAEWVDQGRRKPTRHAFSIGSAVLQPRSRGSIALASADPLAAPTIRLNVLADDEDLRLLAHGFALSRAVGEAPALDAFRGREIVPGPGVGADAEAVRAWIRTRAQTVYHPVGTCRMGVDALAVVDPALRVHGIDGLRVADASVAPVITRGHTAALATVVGERAADLVRQDAGPRMPVVSMASAVR